MKMESKFYANISLFTRTCCRLLIGLSMAFILPNFLQAQTPGSALNFNGSSTTVTIPSSPSLNISKAITIESWVYVTKSSLTDVQDVVSKSTASVNNGYIFPRFTPRNAELQFYLRFDFSNNWTILSVPFGNAMRNAWHHLAATYDGYYMTIYIDGTVAGTLAYSGDISVNNNPLTLGNQPGASEYFGGSVDELRIWNRALSGCELTNNMNCELSGPQSGLAAYYKFNQGLINLPNPLVTTLTDASGNGNDGTLNGFLLTGLTSNWATGTVSGACTVWSPITATAGAVKTIVPRGEDINLLATGPVGATYSWTGPNGFTSTQQNPVITSPGTNASGLYTVTVSKNGCSVQAVVSVTVANRATGLNFASGSSNIVVVPNSPSLNPANISIETWINPSSNLPETQNVVCKSSKFNRVGYMFPRTQDGWKSFSFMLFINGQWYTLSAPYGSNFNQWNHVAATYDGFFMKIYLNGQLKGTLQVTGTLGASSNPLLIGQQDGEPEGFVGSVDETRIWGRALSECEIQNNMNCQLYGDNNALASQNALLAYFRYNQGLIGVSNSAETVLADSSGNGNNGTLQHFALTGTSSTWTEGRVTSTCAPISPIVATASSNGPNIETGTTLQLLATPSGNGLNYSWTGPGNFTSNQQNPSIPNADPTMSGNYTVSVSGNGCTTIATTKVTVANKAGTLDFDGINDNVIVPGNSSIQISKEITLESWVYATNGNQNVQDVMGNSTQNANSGYIFPRTDDGWKHVTFYLHVNGSYQVLSAPYPGLNEWHHCAATYDGFYMRIYVDGILVASQEVVGSITINNNDLNLGFQPGFGEYFSGRVDETRLWNRALSQCEIISNMDCQLSNLQSNGLVAYFQYNQGFLGADNSAENTAIDASGNNNNGTLNNFALNGSTSNWAFFKVNTTCSTYSEPPVVALASADVYGVGSTIILTAAGGTTYNWSGPNGFVSTSSNPTIANAQTENSGVYSVTVPFVKCSITKSLKLTVSALDPVTADGPTTFCPSSSVNLTTNAVGTYQWYVNDQPVTGAGANSATYTVTQSGSYSVRVTNAAGIAQYTAPINVTVIDNRAPVPVTATLPVLNLLSPVTLTTIPAAIDNCSGTIQGVPDRSLLFNTPGTYTITWTYDDHNGNISTQTQQVIVTPGQDLIPPVLTVPANQTLAANTTVCGAVASFSASATDNSGDPVTITYSIASGTVFPVGVNTVTVTATDRSDNVTTGTFTITVTPTIVAPVQGNTTICQNATTQLSSATAGGTWSSANTAIATVNSNGLVTGVSAGTVVISYTDACGVAATATITVLSQPSAPSVTVTNNCGNSVLTASDYTGSLLWSNGATTQSITVTNAATYTVTQTINGCTSAVAVGVSAPKAVPSAPVVTVSNNCGNSVLTASNYSGSLLWSNGAATASITVTDAATYTVTQTVNGCVSAAASAASAPKAVPSAPVVTVSNNCGNAVLTASNYTGNLLWSNGATTASVTVTDAATYTVTQTVNGCTSPAAAGVSAPLAVPSAPVVTVSNNCGNSVLTAANYTGSLLWSNGATTQSITVTNAATYTVTQTIHGCTSAVAVGVSSPKATPSAPVVTVSNNCGNSVLTASNYSGSLLWSNGAATASITVTDAATYTVTQTVNGCVSAAASAASAPKAVPSAPVVTVSNNCGNSVLTASNYSGSLLWSNGATTASVTVTDAATYTVAQTVNGCTSPAASGVSAPKAVLAAPAVTVSNNCGNSVLTASNYTGSLLWSNGATTASITVTNAATYTVTQTANGCTSPAAAGVSAPKATPSAPIVTVVNNCGSAVLTASSYTGSLLWSNGANTASITVTNGGSYSVTQTVNGCTSAAASVAAAPLTAPAAPFVTVVNNCGNAVLTASNYTGSILWSNGATTASITVTTGGAYSVTQSVNGCVSTAAIATAAPKALQTVPVVTVVNNCGSSVLTASNYTGNLLWSNGASTPSITVTTAGNYSVTATTVNGCSATSAVTPVTVTNGTSAPATITVSGADAFCNKTVLTASSTASNATYKWTYGSTVVGTNAQLNLGLANADGVYQVVASVNGCNSQPATYTYQKQNLISSYTILANSDIDLGDNNIVASGSVGVIDAKKGDVAFGANSSVASPGSFVKSRSITIKKSWWWSNVNIANPIYSAATGITLPQMYYNTSNPKSFPNGEVKQYTTNVTLNGNYNNLTIKKGAVVTLGGTIFGNLKIEQGAQVTFTAATINIDQLQVSKGPRYGYTYVRFAQDAKVLVSSYVSVYSQAYINPDNQNVTFYLGDNKSDKEKFSVKGGDTRVNANIYIPNGELKVTGGYRYGDYGYGHGDCDRDDDDDRYYGQGDNYVYMTGLFLVDELEGFGKNVIWNSFDCSAAPAQVLPVMTSTVPVVTAQSENASATSETTVKQSEEELKITVMPNPSTTYFTLKLESKYETPVNLRVMDAAGRVVDARSKLGANSTLQIGAAYMVGTYYAEFIQGNQRKVVQLIKIR
jgi:hypothetical protein